MTLQLVSSTAARRITRDADGAIDRAATVKQMAEHLVAAILHDSLDTSSDVDVIECLRTTPELYHYRIVLDHMDDAMAEAKQTLVAMEISK
ncbi:MAG: hypothetical protein JWL86_622 [Rhizobium sp.]|nr:hypothetical protein [Rhizobium sp.]